jgi:hypothetical protein
MARVQTPDLAAPDPIRPAPIQSDTFAAPAPPPIDNRLAQLADGLGAFNRGVTALAATADKKAKDDRLLRMQAEFDRWAASTTSDDQLNQLWAGKAPYQSDPIFRKAVATYFGGKQAKALAGELDREFQEGKIPYGSQDFNPDRFVLDRADGIVQRYGNDPDFIGSFRKGLDAIRGRVTESHETAKAQGVAALANQVLTDNFRDVLDQALPGQLTPEQTLGTMRQIMKETGPRLQGGSLGIRYGAAEDALLNVFEEYADRPEYGGMLRAMLTTEREDLTGSGVKLGSFLGDAKKGDRARAILVRVQAAQEKAGEQIVRQRVSAAALEAFDRGDGSFSEFGDVLTRGKPTNPANPSKTISISSDEVSKATQDAWLAQQREKAGGVDYATEIAKFAANGMVHPEIDTTLKRAYVAASMTVSNGKPLDQSSVDLLKKAGDLYEVQKKVARNSIKLSDDQRDFFELYTTLKEIGLPPVDAANGVIRAYSDSDSQDPTIAGQNRERIQKKMASADFNAWYSLGGTAQNQGLLVPKVTRLAQAMVRSGMMSPEEAVEKSIKLVSEQAVFVNGHALFGVPNLEKDDVPYVKEQLNGIYKQFGPGLKQLYGINSADELSVASVGNTGRLMVFNRSTGAPISVFDPGAQYDASRPDEMPTVKQIGIDISVKQIKKVRALEEEAGRTRAREEAIAAAGKPTWVDYLMKGQPFPYKTDGSQQWKPNSGVTPPSILGDLAGAAGDVGSAYIDLFPELSRRGKEQANFGVSDTVRAARKRLNNGNVLERK